MIKDKKHFIKNVYYMLLYALDCVKNPAFKSIASEDFDGIEELFATILSRGLAFQLKKGLHRNYENKEEDLSVVRGKIALIGTIKNRIKHKNLATCNFDDLSVDNIFNQIIKTTAFQLLKSKKVSPKIRKVLKEELLFFSEVSSIDLSLVRWEDFCYGRNNISYRPLMLICQLLVESKLLSSDASTHKLPDFIDEKAMHKLYERFILGYFYHHYRLGANAAHIPWDTDEGEGLPKMKSDITLHDDKTILIIDAKYYSSTTQENFGKKTLISHNMYQIFTYVNNMQKSDFAKGKKVHGMLLYAKVEDENFEHRNYDIAGNKYETRVLDLNRPSAELYAQLDKIAEEYFPNVQKHEYE